jgi:glycosyltransferase involved in cell wall biosynthesis
MKIMVLSTLYPPNLLGGAEKSVALIAGGLAARGHEVSVLTLHDKPTATETIQDGVTVLRRPSRNLYWPFPSDDRRSTLAKMTFHVMDSLNVLMARTVGEAMRRYRPEIVLSNQLSCFSTLSWKAIHDAGVATLHTFRDFYLLCPKSKMFRDGKPCVGQCGDCRVLAYPRKRMSHYVDGVTGVSQYMIDEHEAYGLFQNALFLPSILSAVKVPADLSARSLAAPETVRHFGYIGRVEPEKGIDLLLDGLMEMPPGQWKLSIAGSGSEAYLDHLRARCTGLPVEFLGFVPDTEFYASVDVVVAPSIWAEPLPRTVLEAFGHGLTVIASDRGGIPEVLKPGETGYLIDLDKPQEMAAAVARAVSHPLEGRGFGRAGRQIVMARTEATVAEDYEAASQKVIEHAKARRTSPNLQLRSA